MAESSRRRRGDGGRNIVQSNRSEGVRASCEWGRVEEEEEEEEDSLLISSGEGQKSQTKMLAVTRAHRWEYADR
jgi:hypothetical protein